MNKTDDTTTIADIKKHIGAFVTTRNWQKYHADPRNTLLALAEEVGELLANYRYTTEEEAKNRAADPVWGKKIRDELADTLTMIVEFAYFNNIDVSEAFYSKMEEAEVKYPADKTKGKMDKYDTYS